MMWAFGVAAAIVLWWLLFSRARWFERLGALALMIVGLAGAWLLKHESMGPLWLAAYAIPGVCLALVAGAAAGRRLPDRPRRATMAAAILLACGVWTLVRTTGIDGDHVAEFGWRWTKSPEERLLAQTAASRRRARRLRPRRLPRSGPGFKPATSRPRSPRLRQHRRLPRTRTRLQEASKSGEGKEHGT